MTRAEEIKDIEISLEIAKTRLVETAVTLERAAVARRHAEIDVDKLTGRLARLARETIGTQAPGPGTKART